MSAAPAVDLSYAPTDGDIAVNNLESVRLQSWSRFWQEPLRPGIAECIVEQEQLTSQFLGDLTAFDRLGTLVNQLKRVDAESPRTALIQAQVASMTHRFFDARGYLAKAEFCGEFVSAANRLSLSIDQACGTGLEAVLEVRRIAAQSGNLEDLVPLGALQADLRKFDEADLTYRRALSEYRQTSPFAVAWVCFQLGSLWGELVAEPQPERAERWYRKAIGYVPSYVKARVHLSEILLDSGRLEGAEALLSPVTPSGDPEVNWRLADVMAAMGNLVDAGLQMRAARSGFDELLEKHVLAFADHGAEFYSGSGSDAERAFELARINLQNRPTLRAFEQAHETALGCGQSDAAEEILTSAEQRWGTTLAFESSRLGRSSARTRRVQQKWIGAVT